MSKHTRRRRMTREPPAADARAAPRGFADTEVWIFDLDNTLYPSECNLFAQVDQRMGEFIARELGLPFAQARHLQKAYYRQFGTTLAGLMQIHGMAPGPFLDYVHDIDLSGLARHPELAANIAALPGRKLIFTNGSRRHAERVAEALGVIGAFEDICGIEARDFHSKPAAESFRRMMARHAVDARRAAMFEDMPPNLEVPHALGMTTVLVRSRYIDHPAHAKALGWSAPPTHVHYVTDDLAGFLAQVKTQTSQG